MHIKLLRQTQFINANHYTNTNSISQMHTNLSRYFMSSLLISTSTQTNPSVLMNSLFQLFTKRQIKPSFHTCRGFELIDQGLSVGIMHISRSMHSNPFNTQQYSNENHSVQTGSMQFSQSRQFEK